MVDRGNAADDPRISELMYLYAMLVFVAERALRHRQLQQQSRAQLAQQQQQQQSKRGHLRAPAPPLADAKGVINMMEALSTAQRSFVRGLRSVAPARGPSSTPTAHGSGGGVSGPHHLPARSPVASPSTWRAAGAVAGAAAAAPGGPAVGGGSAAASSPSIVEIGVGGVGDPTPVSQMLMPVRFRGTSAGIAAGAVAYSGSGYETDSGISGTSDEEDVPAAGLRSRRRMAHASRMGAPSSYGDTMGGGGSSSSTDVDEEEDEEEERDVVRGSQRQPHDHRHGSSSSRSNTSSGSESVDGRRRWRPAPADGDYSHSECGSASRGSEGEDDEGGDSFSDDARDDHSSRWFRTAQHDQQHSRPRQHLQQQQAAAAHHSRSSASAHPGGGGGEDGHTVHHNTLVQLPTDLFEVWKAVRGPVDMFLGCTSTPLPAASTSPAGAAAAAAQYSRAANNLVPLTSSLQGRLGDGADLLTGHPKAATTATAAAASAATPSAHVNYSSPSFIGLGSLVGMGLGLPPSGDVEGPAGAAGTAGRGGGEGGQHRDGGASTALAVRTLPWRPSATPLGALVTAHAAAAAAAAAVAAASMRAGGGASATPASVRPGDNPSLHGGERSSRGRPARRRPRAAVDDDDEYGSQLSDAGSDSAGSDRGNHARGEEGASDGEGEGTAAQWARASSRGGGQHEAATAHDAAATLRARSGGNAAWGYAAGGGVPWVALLEALRSSPASEDDVSNDGARAWASAATSATMMTATAATMPPMGAAAASSAATRFLLCDDDATSPLLLPPRWPCATSAFPSGTDALDGVPVAAATSAASAASHGRARPQYAGAPSYGGVGGGARTVDRGQEEEEGEAGAGPVTEPAAPDPLAPLDAYIRELHLVLQHSSSPSQHTCAIDVTTGSGIAAHSAGSLLLPWDASPGVVSLLEPFTFTAPGSPGTAPLSRDDPAGSSVALVPFEPLLQSLFSSATLSSSAVVTSTGMHTPSPSALTLSIPSQWVSLLAAEDGRSAPQLPPSASNTPPLPSKLAELLRGVPPQSSPPTSLILNVPRQHEAQSPSQAATATAHSLYRTAATLPPSLANLVLRGGGGEGEEGDAALLLVQCVAAGLQRLYHGLREGVMEHQWTSAQHAHASSTTNGGVGGEGGVYPTPYVGVTSLALCGFGSEVGRAAIAPLLLLLVDPCGDTRLRLAGPEGAPPDPNTVRGGGFGSVNGADKNQPSLQPLESPHSRSRTFSDTGSDGGGGGATAAVARAAAATVVLGTMALGEGATDILPGSGNEVGMGVGLSADLAASPSDDGTGSAVPTPIALSAFVNAAVGASSDAEDHTPPTVPSPPTNSGIVASGTTVSSPASDGAEGAPTLLTSGLPPPPSKLVDVAGFLAVSPASSRSTSPMAAAAAAAATAALVPAWRVDARTVLSTAAVSAPCEPPLSALLCWDDAAEAPPLLPPRRQQQPAYLLQLLEGAARLPPPPPVERIPFIGLRALDLSGNSLGDDGAADVIDALCGIARTAQGTRHSRAGRSSAHHGGGGGGSSSSVASGGGGGGGSSHTGSSSSSTGSSSHGAPGLTYLSLADNNIVGGVNTCEALTRSGHGLFYVNSTLRGLSLAENPLSEGVATRILLVLADARGGHAEDDAEAAPVVAKHIAAQRKAASAPLDFAAPAAVRQTSHSGRSKASGREGGSSSSSSSTHGGSGSSASGHDHHHHHHHAAPVPRVCTEWPRNARRVRRPPPRPSLPGSSTDTAGEKQPRGRGELMMAPPTSSILLGEEGDPRGNGSSVASTTTFEQQLVSIRAPYHSQGGAGGGAADYQTAAAAATAGEEERATEPGRPQYHHPSQHTNTDGGLGRAVGGAGSNSNSRTRPRQTGLLVPVATVQRSTAGGDGVGASPAWSGVNSGSGSSDVGSHTSGAADQSQQPTSSAMVVTSGANGGGGGGSGMNVMWGKFVKSIAAVTGAATAAPVNNSSNNSSSGGGTYSSSSGNTPYSTTSLSPARDGQQLQLLAQHHMMTSAVMPTIRSASAASSVSAVSSVSGTTLPVGTHTHGAQQHGGTPDASLPAGAGATSMSSSTPSGMAALLRSWRIPTRAATAGERDHIGGGSSSGAAPDAVSQQKYQLQHQQHQQQHLQSTEDGQEAHGYSAISSFSGPPHATPTPPLSTTVSVSMTPKTLVVSMMQALDRLAGAGPPPPPPPPAPTMYHQQPQPQPPLKWTLPHHQGHTSTAGARRTSTGYQQQQQVDAMAALASAPPAAAHSVGYSHRSLPKATWPVTSLAYLNLSACGLQSGVLSNAVVKCLEHNRTLRVLDLSGNALSSEAGSRFVISFTFHHPHVSSASVFVKECACVGVCTCYVCCCFAVCMEVSYMTRVLMP